MAENIEPKYMKIMARMFKDMGIKTKADLSNHVFSDAAFRDALRMMRTHSPELQSNKYFQKYSLPQTEKISYDPDKNTLYAGRQAEYNENKTPQSGHTSYDGAGKLLPNIEKVTVDTRKVTEYALNPKNTSGGANKARVFESVLGYNQSKSDHLMQQIQNKLPTSKAILGMADKYGQRFTVDIPVTGPNGKTAIVRTGWILGPGSDVPRMTTIYVK